jgi:hypothetical protein
MLVREIVENLRYDRVAAADGAAGGLAGAQRYGALPPVPRSTASAESI